MSVMASQITGVSSVSIVSSSLEKKTFKLRVIGLYAGNSPVTGEFPTRKSSNTEYVSIKNVTMTIPRHFYFTT